MNVASQYDRRRGLIDALSAEGVEGLAADLVADATAQVRHEMRSEAAFRAAWEWVRGVTGGSFLVERGIHARAVLAADLVGLGGRHGIEGISTQRHPAFASCGKGRKQARDGGAWTSAIQHALTSRGQFRVTAAGGGLWGTVMTGSGGEETARLPNELFPRPWLTAVAAVGLLAVTGANVRDIPFRFGGEPREWSDLYRRAVLNDAEIPSVEAC